MIALQAAQLLSVVSVHAAKNLPAGQDVIGLQVVQKGDCVPVLLYVPIVQSVQ